MSNEFMTPELAAELIKKKVGEISETVEGIKSNPNLSDADVKGALELIAAAEMANGKARTGVLAVCGVTPEDASNDPAEGTGGKDKAPAKVETVETLDHSKPFSMVHCKIESGFSTKHFIQDGKIYDCVSELRRKDLEG